VFQACSSCCVISCTHARTLDAHVHGHNGTLVAVDVGRRHIGQKMLRVHECAHTVLCARVCTADSMRLVASLSCTA
jgi:hypothetical protein